MHIFDYRFLATEIPAELSDVSNIIYDLRARNELRLTQDSDLYERLQSSAIIESVRGSNSIEGIVTTRLRLEQIVQGTLAPTTHGEQEILGYKNALQEIYTPDFHAELTEDYIKHLHQLMLGNTSNQAGRYKATNSIIQERDRQGRLSVRFVPVSAAKVPDAMDQLILAYQEARQTPHVNPLALIACVIVDFLCIHPFMDGNGRMSRLLTTMLLQETGFHIGRLVSIEGMIDEHKAGYYDALRDASVGWHDNESDYTPFIIYLLQILYACYRELDQRYFEDSLVRIPKAQRVENLLMSSYVPISKADICQRLPEVSVKTVERVLGKLVKEGRVEKIGSYRDARYRRC